MLEVALRILGHLVAVRKRPAIHLVVCGGSALIALNLATRTTNEELHAAARWTFTQDASDAFRQAVGEVLHALGHGGPNE